MDYSRILLVAALTLAGCHTGAEGESDEHHHHEEETHGSSTEIVFDEERQAQMGVECGTVMAAPFTRTIKAGGRILTAASDEITLVAPSSGTVMLSSACQSAGMSVSAGTTLAKISSQGIAGGDRLEKARAAYDAARAQYMRDSVLVKDNIVSAAHFEESRLAYQNARLEYEALSGKGGVSGQVTVSAGCSGRITRILVSNGQYVEAGQPVVSVSVGRTLELQAEVPARYAELLSTCNDARFTTPRGDLLRVSEIGGRIIGRSQNAVDGYLTLSFIIPQTAGLVGGVCSDVWVMTSSMQPVISVPAEAVIEEQGLTSVFIRLDEDCFEKRVVKLGDSDGERYIVLSGLKVGEEIVMKGAMHIRLATFSAIPHGHNHNH